MVRISLTNVQNCLNSNVNRFVVNPLKIVGLIEDVYGNVTVSFVGENGKTISTVVQESYDVVLEAIEYADYVKTVELGITQ